MDETTALADLQAVQDAMTAQFAATNPGRVEQLTYALATAQMAVALLFTENPPAA